MKTNTPKIITIIPTYRRPELLKRAIKSVLNQTYPHFEVHVYDNASDDETASVVSAFVEKDTRVKYHCHSKNIGAIKNFNYGISRVETPIFSILSDDDLLIPDFYEVAVNGFEKYPEAKFLITRTIVIDAKGNIMEVTFTDWEEKIYNPPQGCVELARPVRGGYGWTGILFKKVASNINFLDENIGNLIDFNFVLNYAARYPFVVLPEIGAIFTLNPSSAGRLGRYNLEEYKKFAKIADNLRSIEEIAPYFSNIEQSLINFSQRMLFYSGIAGIIEKNFPNAYKSAEIFNGYYQLKSKAFFLKVLADICKYFPWLSDFLGFLMKTRKKNRRKKLYKSGVIKTKNEKYFLTNSYH